MTRLNLSVAYDGGVNAGATSKDDTATFMFVGLQTDQRCAFLRFDLTSLPADAVIDSAALLIDILGVLGSSREIKVWPYNVNGQADPQPDSAADAYARCDASGSVNHGYVFFPTTGLRVLPLPWKELIMDAKRAVGRFAIGLSSTLSGRITIRSLEDAGTTEPRLALDYHRLLVPNEGGRLRHRASITDAYNQVKAHVI